MKNKEKPRLGNPSVQFVRELSKRGFDTVIRCLTPYSNSKAPV